MSMVEGEGGPPSTPGLWRTAISSSVYLFLVYLGLAMSGSPFTNMVLERACNNHNITWTGCHRQVDGVPVVGYDDAQKSAARWMSFFSLSNGLLQVAFCSFYGVLGDAYGRRFPLILPLVGGVFSGLAIVLVPASRANDVLLILTFFTSILGGQYVTNHAAMATLADVTQHASPQQRSFVFSMVEAANWGGLLVGPTIGGFFAEQFGNQQALFAPLSTNAFNLVLTVLTYRETLDVSQRRPFNGRRANPFVAMWLFTETKTVALLACVLVFGMFAQTGGGSVLGLYAIKIADLSPIQLGEFSTVQLGSGCLGLIFLMPLLTRCMSLVRLMGLSMLNAAVCWLLISVAWEAWQLFVIAVFFMLNAVFFPIIRTGVVNTFGRHRYGESLAAIGTVEQATIMLAPFLMQTLYGATLDYQFSIGPLTVGFVAGLVCAASCMLGFAATLGIPAIPANCDWEDLKLARGPSRRLVQQPQDLEPEEE